MPNYTPQIRRLFGPSPVVERITMRAVTQIVVEKSGTSLKDIMSDRRDVPSVTPRHIAYYLCRHHTPRSYMQIADFFDRDHGTIIHGVQQIEKKRGEDWYLNSVVESCETEIAERWP